MSLQCLLCCGDRAGAVVHRLGLAWDKLWANKRQFTTRGDSVCSPNSFP